MSALCERSLRVLDRHRTQRASSGDHVRHRLSSGGNRHINRVLHIMAVVQLRNPTEGRAYFDRKKATGKTSMEAMRCINRRLSDLVYKTMFDDLVAAQKTGPRGLQGNDAVSSATGSQPSAGSSDKSHPGPSTRKPPPFQPRLEGNHVSGPPYSAGQVAF